MSNILDQLNAWDQQLMVLLNYEGSAFTNAFWLNYSSVAAWIVSAVCILAVILYRSRANWRESILIILSIALLVTLCDQISASVIKPFVARFRPSHEPAICDLLYFVNGYKGGRYGFVSSHATNSFGMALFQCLLFRKRAFAYTIILWSILNCYSRIYLGVHYLGDILGGSLLGLLLGAVVYKMYEWVHNHYLMPKFGTPSIDAIYRQQEPWPIIAAVWGTIGTLLVIALVSAL